MSGRRLKWVKAAPCNGVVYSMHAWIKIAGKEVKFSIARMTSAGHDQFMLYKGDDFAGLFTERIAALNHAEGLI